MIVLTLTRPWLLVGYRALGRKWASSGLVRGIGEAVTQASTGAALGRPGAPFGRPGTDRRTWGGQTDVGRARRPAPHSSQEPGRRRGSLVQLFDLSVADRLSKDREDDVSLTGLVKADRATHVQPDTVLACGDRDVVGSHAPRQAVTDLPYVN